MKWNASKRKIAAPLKNRWANFNITTKFNVAFGGLLTLLLLVSSTSYLFLSIVYRQTESAIFTSAEIQRRVLELDAKLKTARVYERDFFLRYPTVGFNTAQQDYASKAVTHIAEVIRLSKELETLIQSSNVSDSLREQNIDLTRYFFFAERYKETFLSAIDVATRLAGEDDGLWGKLDSISDQILNQLSGSSERDLITLYYQMRTLEKEYRITHEVTALQRTLNVAFDLEKLLEQKGIPDSRTRGKLQDLLSTYELTLRNIEDLDREIWEKFKGFELQASQVDPVSLELIRLSKEEVERAQTQILYTSRWANTSLGTTVIVGLILASLIARILNSSITKRVILLHRAVEGLEAGDLDVRTKVDKTITTPDELDRLGQSFNTMANQLQAMFTELEETNDQLEQRVRDRTFELSNALKQLQNTQAQLVQTEKMSSLGQMVAGVAHEINNPVSFIYGNISPAYEYIDELTELIHLYQMHYPKPHPIIEEYIDEMDLEFVQQDLWKLLDSMKEGATRIREIVKSLRVFSRLDESDFKDVDIHLGLDSTLMLLKNRLKHANDSNGVEIIKKYGVLPLVDCYPGQLNQVFMNILVNAIDALESHRRKIKSLINRDQNNNLPKSAKRQTLSEIESGIDHQAIESQALEFRMSQPSRIEIQTQVIDSDWILVKITDNGPGLSVAVKDKLFDPFFTTKPVGKGTGLGLSVSYQIIVERHGGKLWCASTPGHGTTFNIQIPIHQASADATDGHGDVLKGLL